MKSAIALALLLLSVFCGWGFIASFEGGPQAIYFRVGCATVGAAFVAVSAVLRPWRFSVRDLLIATTLLAVVLGTIAWLDRAWIGK